MTERTSSSPTKERIETKVSAALGLARPRALALVLVVAAGAPGCVSKELYAQTLADLQFERNRTTDLEKKLAAAQAEIKRLGEELAARDAKLDQLNVAQASLARELEELKVLNAALQGRLKQAGQSVDQLATEKGSLNDELARTRKQLDELKRQQAAAEARLAQFQELVRRFQKLAEAGKLKVVMRQGRMIIALPTDVLFDSGKSDLRAAGRDTILEVGKILASMPDRRFQVAGHTDNVKISTPRFPSNWELSTARSVEVVKLLVEASMKPENVSAAGYGEYDALTANDTPENRQQNRRIEITLVPDLAELIQLPSAK
jgi:chemotaxis protein MotB